MLRQACSLASLESLHHRALAESGRGQWIRFAQRFLFKPRPRLTLAITSHKRIKGGGGIPPTLDGLGPLNMTHTLPNKNFKIPIQMTHTWKIIESTKNAN